MSAPRQILVLDSDDASQAAFIADLAVLGAVGFGAASLEDARAALAQGSWTAIVASLQLAEGNPLELLGRLSEGRPMPPIIAVSRVVRRQDLLRAIRTPVCDFLEQPVSLAALACALERAAGAIGVAPRTSAAQPEAFIRTLRQAMGVVAGAPGFAAVCARNIGARPTMRAAWIRLQELEAGLPALDALGEVAPGIAPMRLAAATIAAAALAEALRLEGAWQVQAEAVAVRAVERAQALRLAAPEVGVDPDTVFLAAVLRGVGGLLLLLQAAARYAVQGPSPEVLARAEEAGPRTAGAMFRSWSIPSELLERFAIPDVEGRLDDSPLSRLLDGRGGTASSPAAAPVPGPPPGPAVSGPAEAADWPVLMRATWTVLERALALEVPSETSLTCSLVSGAGQVPVRLCTLGRDRAQVRAAGAGDASRLLGGEAATLLLEVRSATSQVQVPVSASAPAHAEPPVIDLRFTGSERVSARLRSVVLVAMNRRQAVRVDGDDEAPVVLDLRGAGGAEPGEAVLVDVSTSGLGLLTDPGTADRMAIGDRLSLSLALPTQALPLPVVVCVVHSQALRVMDPETRTRHDVVRLGVALDPSAGGRARIDQALTRYVMRRQREVLRQRG